MNIEQFFYEHPVFRYEEFAAWKVTQGDIKPGSVNMALQYYVKSGQLRLIRRKLYVVIPPDQSADDFIVDPYLVAAKASDDSVLGYHSALALMGMAYSSFGQFTYITQRKNKSFEFQNQWFQPVSFSTRLQNKVFTYVETIDRQGVSISVTNVARTFVDVLDRVGLSGGWEEVCRAVSNIVVLNVDEVIEYCLLLGNARLNAKVGYFLSQREGAFAVNEKQLQPLLVAVPKTPVYVSKRSQEKCQLVKPWNILLPESVVNRTWEEPDADI